MVPRRERTSEAQHCLVSSLEKGLGSTPSSTKHTVLSTPTVPYRQHVHLEHRSRRVISMVRSMMPPPPRPTPPCGLPFAGHGQHLTGLGHVKDLAKAMANILGKEEAVGQVYNIQDNTAISFDGMVRACAQAMGKDPAEVKIKHFDPSLFDFGKKKAFPMRPGHFFTSIEKAMTELDWEPEFPTVEGLKDSYENDFIHKKAAGGLKNDFECDDIVLNDQRLDTLLSR
ncbi:unnamed protein product [Discosporangium mesarthrocarpum]